LKFRDKIIIKTAEIFTETYNFIKDFTEFKYVNKSDKIENVKKAKHYEQLCNKQKEKFDTIVNKIQNKEQAFIESARNSLRMSSFTQGKEMNDLNQNKDMEMLFKNGKEYLESNIDERQKQINLISKYVLTLCDFFIYYIICIFFQSNRPNRGFVQTD